jgi:hypothetical protein
VPAVPEEKQVFEFFRIWLLVVTGAAAVAGAIGVLIVGTPLFALINPLIDRAFWATAPDAATRRFQAWSYGVMFAVLAGWGMCMAMLVANAFATRQAWVWWSIAGSVALWFPLDTGRSLYHRVWANAAGNAALLALLAIPLIGTFSDFR